jgi:hypothetical protein
MPKLWREDEDEVNVMKRNNKSEKCGTKKTWENSVLKNKIHTNMFSLKSQYYSYQNHSNFFL